MQVHNALNFTLIGIRRRNHETPIETDGDRDQRQSAKNSSAFSYRLGRWHGS